MTDLSKRPKPQIEDYVRAAGYLVLMVWAVLFYVFPTMAFHSDVTVISRTIWLAATFIGGGMALAGALVRIDLKLEFPGILFALIGPVFYTLSQLYLSIYPAVTDTVPGQRIAITAFSFLVVVLLLPRAISLLVEKNRLKEQNK